MSDRPLLPLLGEPSRERADAARNRDALLVAAAALVSSCGAERLTMDAVAAEAGVGKGTVFRRFGSRQGLLAAVLDHSEAAWQGEVISGPPPLGPGADPRTRLRAFGHSRAELNLRHAGLIIGAGGSRSRSSAAFSFASAHVQYLLRELGVDGDLPLLALALLAPLEAALLAELTGSDQVPLERILTGWDDLVDRVIGYPGDAGSEMTDFGR